MSLSALMATGLPLNRKERFYTGTVLPMITCSDGFGQFWRLAKLMGVSGLHVDANPATANLQFFTEYGFAESAVTKAAKEKFPAGFPSKETPDLLMYVDGDPRRLFAVEAKMFHRPDKDRLVEQLFRQKGLLEFLRTSLLIGASEVFHAALLPDPFAKEVGKLPVRTITWEAVLNAYDGVAPAYFLEMLRLALQSYGELKSQATGAWGVNMEAKISGAEIYERYLDGTLEFPFIGRTGGLNGSKLAHDIDTGGWKSQSYEVRKTELPGNHNWFAVAEFVARIDEPSRRREPDSVSTALDSRRASR